MIKAEEIIRAGPKYLGTPYREMDCQAFVEKCLEDAGIRMNLAGSNAWYREIMRSGWTGTPEECRRIYGEIPKGAFLFVLKQDGKEPAKYQGDGIGNANHIGIYTGMTGAEMCTMSGKEGAIRYNFGSGAINSSYTHGCVCTSKFAGKAISGGWNRIGLWLSRIDYGKGGEGMPEDKKARVTGGTLNMRKEPSTKAALIAQIPNGTEVTILEEKGEWDRISYGKNTGYVMSKYLKKDDGSGTIAVSRAELQEIYDKIGQMLRG